jgi:hypothetical protein
MEYSLLQSTCTDIYAPNEHSSTNHCNKVNCHGNFNCYFTATPTVHCGDNTIIAVKLTSCCSICCEISLTLSLMSFPFILYVLLLLLYLKCIALYTSTLNKISLSADQFHQFFKSFCNLSVLLVGFKLNTRYRDKNFY